MSHKCFISFKKEDQKYKDNILTVMGDDHITGKALDKTIDSDDIDYVMQTIRNDYMKNTSVTIFLIGEHSSEKEGKDSMGRNKQSFIIKELQATLYNGTNFSRSGLLGIVLPHMYAKIYKGHEYCQQCNENHSIVQICDNTVIREFSANFYLKPKEDGCKQAYSEDGKFCVLVKYDDFIQQGKQDKYIDQAFDKTQAKINDFVHWRDLR